LPTIEDAVKAGGFLAGRPEDIVEQLKAVEKRYAGLDRVICATPLGTPLDVQLADLDRFAKEVIPAFLDTGSSPRRSKPEPEPPDPRSAAHRRFEARAGQLPRRIHARSSRRGNESGGDKPAPIAPRGYAFSSRLISSRKRQSVCSAMSFCGLT
jgi:hypothetical protein